MPETFVPSVPPAAPAPGGEFEPLHRPEPTPPAQRDVRRFQTSLSGAVVRSLNQPSFEAVGAAAVPDSLVHAAREKASREGFAAGYAAGLEASRLAIGQDRAAATAARDLAAEGAAAEVADVVRAVQAAARRLEDESATIASTLVDRTFAAVEALTTAVLGHALETGEDSAMHAVRRALQPLPGAGPVVLSLSPRDADVVLAALASAEVRGLDPLGAGREVAVVAQPGLTRGDAVATSGVTEVDARLDASWQRALRALRS